jgi:hypothetical protein
VDELHPTGRCTCAGEGTCDWCLASRLRDPEAWVEPQGAQIVELDEYRPHLVLECGEGHQHVFPLAWVHDLIAGKAVDPLEPCMQRTVLREWLDGVGGE